MRCSGSAPARLQNWLHAARLLRGDWTAPSADSIFDFVQEAHILHMLQHPHLMHAYGVCYFAADSLPDAAFASGPCRSASRSSST